MITESDLRSVVVDLIGDYDVDAVSVSERLSDEYPEFVFMSEGEQQSLIERACELWDNADISVFWRR